VTLASWFIAFAGFALLIILHELGHFVAAKAVGMRVERFALFFPPLLVKKKIGETEYGIGAIPLGGYVRITGMNPAEDLPEDVRDRAYHAQPVWKRIVVVAAGPLVNFVLAFILLLCFFWLVGPRTEITDRVGEITPGMPAVGQLQVGDRILAINGKKGTPEELSRTIATYSCAGGSTTTGCEADKALVVTVQRPGGAIDEVRLRPVYDGEYDRMRVGFGYAAGGPREPVPFDEALPYTADRLVFAAGLTVQLPAKLLDAQQRDRVSGVVGSYEKTRQTIIREPGDTIAILALISLSLAVINLFPFLPLDGGHIFWAIVEKVRRRPVHYATMERAGAVGLLLLIPLFLLTFTNDLNSIFSSSLQPPGQ
jgi:regulator of sigma E protease